MRRTTVPGGMRLAREMEDEARARLRPEVFDYVAGGAGDEQTLRENEEAWRRIWLRPRQLVGVTAPSTSIELLGAPLGLPLLVAPMGGLDRADPEGVLPLARAASGAGAGFVLATRAGTSPSALAGIGGRRWLQLYVHPDRARSEALLAEAREAGFDAAVLTVDLPVPGRRERELAHRALSPPVGGWAPLTWDDVAWAREAAGVPLVLKGILSAEDAELAVAAGADAVVVSNHGGRQLDGSVPAAVALPEVAEAIAGRVPVLVDGGVRDGGDVVRALAFGAAAVLVGRPFAWALAAGGEAAAARLLAAIAEDVARALALVGASSPAEVDRGHVRVRGW